MAEYEPGTIAVATVRGVPNVRVMRTGAERDLWISMEYDGRDYPNGMGSITWHGRDQLADVRPLVVLDPEGNPEGHDQFIPAHFRAYADSLEEAHGPVSAQMLRFIADQIEAQTRPPKPAEPTGIGAVVEDTDGRKWVRSPNATRLGGDWCGIDSFREYAEIDAVRVLSPGVS